MTSCAIKVCRNYKGRLKASDSVSYHRIPSDPIIRSQWIAIIRKSRGEELWKPSKHTQLCSDHFDKKDLYYANNQGRRRLKKGVLPKKALFLSSMESDTTDTSDEDSKLTLEHDIGKDESMKLNLHVSNRRPDMLSDIQPSTSSAKSCDVDLSTQKKRYADKAINEEFSDQESMEHDISKDESMKLNLHVSNRRPDMAKDIQPSTSSAKLCDVNMSSAKNSYAAKTINEGFSDQESIFDTPREVKLKKELRRKAIIQKKQTLKILSLKRQNQRLRKKLVTFKNILEAQRKKFYIYARNIEKKEAYQR